MRIKVNHPSDEIATRIMDWLYENEDVRGDEKDLLDEPLSNLLPQSRIWELEEYLSDIYDDNIDVSGNLKFVEF